MEIVYSYEDETPNKYSEDVKINHLKQTLNSIIAYLLLLVISYAESWFKLLRISWYRNMKPVWTNLKLVINKYLCILHKYFLSLTLLQMVLCWSILLNLFLLTTSIESFINVSFCFYSILVWNHKKMYIWYHLQMNMILWFFLIIKTMLHLMYAIFYLWWPCVFKLQWRGAKSRHKILIFNQESDFTIKSPLKLLE